MNLEDMIIISVDDHVIEPADMYEGHLPAKWADKAPRLVADESGNESWMVMGERLSTVTAIGATVGWPKEEWGFDPSCTAEMRPGCYDLGERIRDMDRNGILASMCFATFPGFSARGFHDMADKDLALVLLQAYNDWHVDELCTSYPGRFIPLIMGPTWDMDALVAEVHRMAKKGCRAISMPELPFVQDIPSYHSDWWDPFFKAVSDEGMVVCLHIGQGFAAVRQPDDAPKDNLMILSTQVSMIAAQDILWGPSLRKFPDLKIAWSEGGIGWLPFYLDRCDRHYLNQRWLRQDFGGKLPSEVFKEHCLACFIADPSALVVRDRIGIDVIAFESDYPHSDCLWPDAPEHLMAELQAAGVGDEEIEKISWENAARFFHWDTFEHIKREDATVGALRAKAEDVDVSIRSRAEWRSRYEAKLSA